MAKTAMEAMAKDTKKNPPTSRAPNKKPSILQVAEPPPPPHYKTWRKSQLTGETNSKKRARYEVLYHLGREPLPPKRAEAAPGVAREEKRETTAPPQSYKPLAPGKSASSSSSSVGGGKEGPGGSDAAGVGTACVVVNKKGVTGSEYEIYELQAPTSPFLSSFQLLYAILLIGESPSTYISSLTSPNTLLVRLGYRSSCPPLKAFAEEAVRSHYRAPPPSSLLRPQRCHKTTASYNDGMKACVLEECRASLAEGLQAVGLLPASEREDMRRAGDKNRTSAREDKPGGEAFWVPPKFRAAWVVSTVEQFGNYGSAGAKKTSENRPSSSSMHEPLHDLAVLSLKEGVFCDTDCFKAGNILLLVAKDSSLFLAGVSPDAGDAQHRHKHRQEDRQQAPAPSRTVTVLTFPSPLSLRLTLGLELAAYPIATLTSFVRMYEALTRDVLGRVVNPGIADMVLCRGPRWLPPNFLDAGVGDHKGDDGKAKAPRHTLVDEGGSGMDRGGKEAEDKDEDEDEDKDKEGGKLRRDEEERLETKRLLHSHPHCKSAAAQGVGVPGPELNDVQEALGRAFIADVLWDEDRAHGLDPRFKTGSLEPACLAPRFETGSLLAEARPPITLVQGPPGTGNIATFSSPLFTLSS